MFFVNECAHLSMSTFIAHSLHYLFSTSAKSDLKLICCLPSEDIFHIYQNYFYGKIRCST